MAQNNTLHGDLDPEIAALLGASTQTKETDNYIPDYSSIFDDPSMGEPIESTENDGSISFEKFPVISKKLEDKPHHKAFDDPNYYKTALAGEGDITQRVHSILQKFTQAKDPKDRGVFRQQFITAFWDFFKGVARKAPYSMQKPKKYLLRFGLLHPNFLSPENRNLFSRVIEENNYNQPVYYLDEWLKAVGTGTVRASTTDEVKVSRSNNAARLQQHMEKAQGKLDGARNLLRAKDEERRNTEDILKNHIKHIMEHAREDDVSFVSYCYNEGQKRAFSDINDMLRNLLKIDRDKEIFFKDYYNAEDEARNLREKLEQEGAATVDVGAVDTEFQTARQMAKMTIGRQGNHFPILMNDYYHCQPGDLGTRENVLAIMAWVESIDPEAFCRTYKNRLNRIIPYVILLPTYGDYGICWEPFDKFNRATSRGRIAIPMYPKSLHNAVLTGIADFRWQVAKEKASFYWMEEGITGNYYQWFQKMKMKGDVKDFFMADYITWITKESEGTQRLDKDLRGMFWRHVPFSQAIKDKLKTRNYVYQELYQRDVNRAMSDGY